MLRKPACFSWVVWIVLCAFVTTQTGDWRLDSGSAAAQKPPAAALSPWLAGAQQGGGAESAMDRAELLEIFSQMGVSLDSVAAYPRDAFVQAVLRNEYFVKILRLRGVYSDEAFACRVEPGLLAVHAEAVARRGAHVGKLDEAAAEQLRAALVSPPFSREVRTRRFVRSAVLLAGAFVTGGAAVVVMRLYFSASALGLGPLAFLIAVSALLIMACVFVLNEAINATDFLEYFRAWPVRGLRRHLGVFVGAAAGVLLLAVSGGLLAPLFGPPVLAGAFARIPFAFGLAAILAVAYSLYIRRRGGNAGSDIGERLWKKTEFDRKSHFAPVMSRGDFLVRTLFGMFVFAAQIIGWSTFLIPGALPAVPGLAGLVTGLWLSLSLVTALLVTGVYGLSAFATYSSAAEEGGYPPAPGGLTVLFSSCFVPASESLDILCRSLASNVNLTYPHGGWVLDEGSDDPARKDEVVHLVRLINLMQLRDMLAAMQAQSPGGLPAECESYRAAVESACQGFAAGLSESRAAARIGQMLSQERWVTEKFDGAFAGAGEDRVRSVFDRIREALPAEALTAVPVRLVEPDTVAGALETLTRAGDPGLRPFFEAFVPVCRFSRHGFDGSPVSVPALAQAVGPKARAVYEGLKTAGVLDEFFDVRLTPDRYGEAFSLLESRGVLLGGDCRRDVVWLLGEASARRYTPQDWAGDLAGGRLSAGFVMQARLILDVLGEGGFLLSAGTVAVADPDARRALVRGLPLDLDEADADAVCNVLDRSRHNWLPASGRLARKSKGGNLNAFLEYLKIFRPDQYATLDFFANMDVDGTAQPDYLQQLLPRFHDPSVAYVTSTEGYANGVTDGEDFTLPSYLGHQFGNHFNSYVQRTSGFMVGSNHVVRFRALREPGGYENHLVEDMMTMLTLNNRGWRGSFYSPVCQVGEGPTSFWSFFKQQLRWSFGGIDATIRHTLPHLGKSKTLREKLHVFCLRTYYSIVGMGSLLSFIVSLATLFLGAQMATSVPFLLAQNCMGLMGIVGIVGYWYFSKYAVGPGRKWQPVWMALVPPSLFAVYTKALVDNLRGRGLSYAVTTKLKHPAENVDVELDRENFWNLTKWNLILLGLYAAGFAFRLLAGASIVSLWPYMIAPVVLAIYPAFILLFILPWAEWKQKAGAFGERLRAGISRLCPRWLAALAREPEEVRDAPEAEPAVSAQPESQAAAEQARPPFWRGGLRQAVKKIVFALPLAGTAALVAFFQFLGTSTPLLHWDEPFYVGEAVSLLGRFSLSWDYLINYIRTWSWDSGFALSRSLNGFGYILSNGDVTLWRLPSVLAGLLASVFIYKYVRNISDIAVKRGWIRKPPVHLARWAALLTVALVALSRTFLFNTHFALPPVVSLLALAAGLYLLTEGIKRSSSRRMIAAALVLAFAGVNNYMYLALLPAVVFLAWFLGRKESQSKLSGKFLKIYLGAVVAYVAVMFQGMLASMATNVGAAGAAAGAAGLLHRLLFVLPQGMGPAALLAVAGLVAVWLSRDKKDLKLLFAGLFAAVLPLLGVFLVSANETSYIKYVVSVLVVLAPLIYYGLLRLLGLVKKAFSRIPRPWLRFAAWGAGLCALWAALWGLGQNSVDSVMQAAYLDFGRILADWVPLLEACSRDNLHFLTEFSHHITGLSGGRYVFDMNDVPGSTVWDVFQQGVPNPVPPDMGAIRYFARPDLDYTAPGLQAAPVDMNAWYAARAAAYRAMYPAMALFMGLIGVVGGAAAAAFKVVKEFFAPYLGKIPGKKAQAASPGEETPRGSGFALYREGAGRLLWASA